MFRETLDGDHLFALDIRLIHPSIGADKAVIRFGDEHPAVHPDNASRLPQHHLDVAWIFRWVFVAADVFLVLALLAIVLLEERPLRGPAANAPVTKAPPLAPEAPPEPAE